MTPLELPKLSKHVSDFSWILTSTQVETLSERFAEHERNTWEQVVTVLFPHRQWYELLDIGLDIFQKNGIGQKHLNNGILLLISTEEKKIRIITGKWMEIQYSEMRCRDIVENHLRPLLDAGRYVTLIDIWHKIISNNLNEGLSSRQYILPKIENISRSRLWKQQSYGVALIWPLSVLFGFIAINWYISWIIWLCIAILFVYILKSTTHILWKKILAVALIFPILLGTLSIVALVTPATCTQVDTRYDGAKVYSCDRNIFWYQRTYTMSTWWASSSSRWASSSSSDWGSSSSSSFFWGWGGSSNGGGYGD